MRMNGSKWNVTDGKDVRLPRTTGVYSTNPNKLLDVGPRSDFFSMAPTAAVEISNDSHSRPIYVLLETGT